MVSFDISPAMIERQLSEMAIKESFFQRPDLDIPIEEVESFDYIFCWHFIIWRYNNCNERISSIAETDGHLIVSVEHPFYDYLYYKSNN